MVSTTNTCQALTKRGEPCSAPPAPGKQYCFHHDPARAVERLEARSAGGKARHGRTIGAGQVEPISVRTTGDIVALLEQAINDTLSLENSLQRARTVGYLALGALKAFELNELEARVEALEAVHAAKL